MENNQKSWNEEDLQFINNAIKACSSYYGENSFTVAWLKSLKDRELPKLSDKNEPIQHKFKVRDWVMFCKHPYQVIAVEDDYVIESYDADILPIAHIKFDEEDKLRAWNINDARMGDILIDDVLTDDDVFFIFKKIGNDSFSDVIDFYAIVNYCYNHFSIQESCSYFGNTKQVLRPATKKEQYLLFQTMEEKGYKWNSSRLKIIEINTEKNPSKN